MGVIFGMGVGESRQNFVPMWPDFVLVWPGICPGPAGICPPVSGEHRALVRYDQVQTW
ncbi:hypothetical protein MalM14_27450 [Gimesia chilikensis]|nr:hypothetical protein MalM14_27450 [Gimesia chilikensis]